MPQLRYFLRLMVAYLSRFKGIIFIGVIVGISLFFVIKIVISLLGRGTTEIIGISGRYTPETLPDNILSMVSRGLTRIDETKIVEPDIASAWETRDKGKTWIFHLKKDIYWQNNEKLLSYDINYDYSDVVLEKPDDETLIFKLNSEFSPFPAVTTSPIFRKGLLGVGEWKVDQIELIGNYVHKLTLLNSEGNKKIYKFYPTIEQTKLAYKLGKINSIEGILNPQPFDTWQTSKVIPKINKNQVALLFINTQDPILSEKSLRQALAYAIDKNRLGERALSPIQPDSWAFNPQVKPYTFDEKRAKEIIDDLPKESKQNLEIKLVSTSQLLPIAEQIADDWERIGIKTIVQVTSIVPSEFQVYLTIFDMPLDPDQYPLWHSTQSSTNISRYSNPRIDKFLEDGRKELDLETRKKIYIDFQRFLLEDLPAIFLYYPTYYTITRK